MAVNTAQTTSARSFASLENSTSAPGAARAAAVTLVVLLLIGAVGCGDGSPVAPNAPPGNIAGKWTGSVTLIQDLSASTQTGISASVEITQSDSMVSGQFTAGRMTGGLSGVVSGNDVTGSLTLKGSDGCTASASMRGALNGPTLNITVPLIGPGTCSWGAQVQMTLMRS